MRMWMVDPAIMCRQHLLGEHVELHMMAAHLRLGRRVDGYVNNNCVEPRSIGARHKALAAELARRGYRHASPLEQPPVASWQRPKACVDAAASLADLTGRCAECAARRTTQEAQMAGSLPVLREHKDTLRVLVSWRCNFRCAYCCNDTLPDVRAGIRPVNLETLDFSQYSVVCVSGGEPLLFMDRVKAVCNKARGKFIVLYTNGTKMTPGVAACLSEWGVNAVNVGLHYPKTLIF